MIGHYLDSLFKKKDDGHNGGAADASEDSGKSKEIAQGRYTYSVKRLKDIAAEIKTAEPERVKTLTAQYTEVLLRQLADMKAQQAMEAHAEIERELLRQQMLEQLRQAQMHRVLMSDDEAAINAVTILLLS